MYNYNFESKYYLECNNVEETDDLYREEFLKAFDCEDWDNDIINMKIDKLFVFLKENSEIQECLKKVKESKQYSVFLHTVGEQKDDMAFRILFSHDYFYLFHQLLREYFKSGNFDKDLLINLTNKI